MLKKGIRQWLKPIDEQKLIARQQKGENYGLFDESSELKVFLSLVKRNEYHEWSNWISLESTFWINTISVNIENKEKGLGKLAILQAIEYLRGNSVSVIYLDCVVNEGFLVKYYIALGFELVAETIATYRSGDFHVALMKLEL